MKISSGGILCAVFFCTATMMMVEPSQARVKIAKFCEGDYGYSKHDPVHHAFAVTGGRSPYSRGMRLSCGRAWGYETKDLAVKEAIRQCNVDKRKTGSAGVCKIIDAK